MKKSDLKTGMCVKLRNGAKALVLCDYSGEDRAEKLYKFILTFQENLYMSSEDFNEDLEEIDGDNNHDIVKVYRAPHPSLVFDFDYRELVWEREIEAKAKNKKLKLLSSCDEFKETLKFLGIPYSTTTCEDLTGVLNHDNKAVYYFNRNRFSHIRNI